MANLLRYISPRGKEITFDAWEDEREEYGTIWVDMCPSCHNKYRGILGNRASESPSAEAACYVKGCSNAVGGWYVDFKVDEVEFI